MSFEGNTELDLTHETASDVELLVTEELELTPEDLASIKQFVTIVKDLGNYAAIALECFYKASPEGPELLRLAIENIVAVTVVRSSDVTCPEGIVEAALALEAVRRRAFHSNLFPDGSLISLDLVKKIKRMYFAQLKAGL